jgi:hypothetical protein
LFERAKSGTWVSGSHAKAPGFPQATLQKTIIAFMQMPGGIEMNARRDKHWMLRALEKSEENAREDQESDKLEPVE